MHLDELLEYVLVFNTYLSQVNKCWTSLAKAQNLEGVSSLFSKHSKDILNNLKVHRLIGFYIHVYIY